MRAMMSSAALRRSMLPPSISSCCSGLLSLPAAVAHKTSAAASVRHPKATPAMLKTCLACATTLTPL
jgi:hypothetical protein